MTESEQSSTHQKPEGKLQRSLKLAGLIAGILIPIVTLILVFFRSLYDRNVLCSVDADACRTRVAQLEGTLESMPTGPPAIHTAQVTVIHTVEVTTTTVSITATPSPTGIPYQSTGSCNAAFSNPPCTYVLSEGDRWQQIAQDSPYGDNCRYPEIMDINRREDGTYPRLSGYDSDIGRPVTIMPAAPAGTYAARIRDALGQFKFLRECRGEGFPCIFTVSEQLPIFTYEQISQTVYRNNIFGDSIAQANLASDCSGRGVALQLGTRLVIPKRPIYTPEPPDA